MAKFLVSMDGSVKKAAMRLAKKRGTTLSAEIRKWCLDLVQEEANRLRPTHKPVTSPVKARPVAQPSDEGLRLATLLFDTVVLAGDANAKQPNLQSWALEVDSLIRIDGRDPAEVEALILWISQDSFERTVVLSTGKLRKRYSQLLIKAKAAVQKNTIKSI